MTLMKRLANLVNAYPSGTSTMLGRSAQRILMSSAQGILVSFAQGLAKLVNGYLGVMSSSTSPAESSPNHDQSPQPHHQP